MGDHNVELELDERMSQAFMKALLDDLRALDFMIETNRFETGVWRIGAEQEMFLVDSNMRPSPISQGGSESCQRLQTDNRDRQVQSRGESDTTFTNWPMPLRDGARTPGSHHKSTYERGAV